MRILPGQWYKHYNTLEPARFSLWWGSDPRKNKIKPEKVKEKSIINLTALMYWICVLEEFLGISRWILLDHLIMKGRSYF